MANIKHVILHAGLLLDLEDARSFGVQLREVYILLDPGPPLRNREIEKIR
jgi:hypothetical protein